MPYSVDYAFTITLKPKAFTKEPECQYDDCNEYIKRKLSSLSQAFTLVMELTKNYNIHSHGIIKFILRERVDCMKEFHKCFRNDSIVGFVNIRQIDDMSRWTEYIRKDIGKTSRITNRRPIIMDSYDVFTEEERAEYGVTW